MFNTLDSDHSGIVSFEVSDPFPLVIYVNILPLVLRTLCMLSRHAHHTLQEFVQNLSTLLRGTMEEKLRWTFQLYDINGDGFITREEMTDIAIAIYELMGRHPENPHPGPDPDQIREKVEKMFTVSFNTCKRRRLDTHVRRSCVYRWKIRKGL